MIAISSVLRGLHLFSFTVYFLDSSGYSFHHDEKFLLSVRRFLVVSPQRETSGLLPRRLLLLWCSSLTTTEDRLAKFTVRNRRFNELMERRSRVADLYLTGRTLMQIADVIGVGRVTVSRDLRFMHQQWCKRIMEDVDKIKARELARIDKLEEQYWIEWERSKENYTSRYNRSSTEGDVTRTESGETVSERLGDPRYLAGIQWCVQKRTEILGLNVPVQSPGGGLEGMTINITLVPADGNGKTEE